VARVSYATSLMKKGVFISTTEHLLSALSVAASTMPSLTDNLDYQSWMAAPFLLWKHTPGGIASSGGHAPLCAFGAT